MKPIDDSLVNTMHRALTRASMRTAMVATNLANIDTPGYRARDLTFDKTLQSAAMEIPGARPATGASESRLARVVERPASRVGPDGNTVDMDLEMTNLARLQGRYTALTQLIRTRFALLRYAATDGKQ